MGQHYFSDHPTAASHPTSVHLVLADLDLWLRTDRAVFSSQRIDPGTRILLEAVPPPPPTGDLLDLGCGYGPIAVVMALRAPKAVIWAVDVNTRALRLCEDNAQRAGLDNVRCRLESEMDPTLRFDAIWSNPPIRIGKPALHSLLTTWLSRLKPTGRAYLVVHRNLGADSLHRWLADRREVTRLASRAGYRVLAVAGT